MVTLDDVKQFFLQFLLQSVKFSFLQNLLLVCLLTCNAWNMYFLRNSLMKNLSIYMLSFAAPWNRSIAVWKVERTENSPHKSCDRHLLTQLTIKVEFHLSPELSKNCFYWGSLRVEVPPLFNLQEGLLDDSI